MKYIPRASRTLAAAFLGATLAAPATAQVLKVTPDFETRATNLIGHTVTDAKGRAVGKIGDLLIQKDGMVGFVVLAVGRELGVGQKLVAVPYAKMSAEGDKVFYKGTPEDLKNATEFTFRQHAMNDSTPRPDRRVGPDTVSVQPLGAPPPAAAPATPVAPEPQAFAPAPVPPDTVRLQAAPPSTAPSMTAARDADPGMPTLLMPPRDR